MGARARTVLVVLVVGASFAACRTSSEQRTHEAAKASTVAQEKLEQSGRDLARGDARGAARAMVESQEADERSARASAEASRAAVHERELYRALLVQEIGWIDRRVMGLDREALEAQGATRAQKEREIAISFGWRLRLAQDLDALDRPHEGVEWTALKKRIDRDLDEDRPPSIPRSYEKVYGI